MPPKQLQRKISFFIFLICTLTFSSPSFAQRNYKTYPNQGCNTWPNDGGHNTCNTWPPIYYDPCDCTCPPPQIDHPVDSASMFMDTTIGRPLAFGATMLGVGLFLVTLPVSVLGNNVDKTMQALVIEPGKATFARGLGEPVEANWDDPEGMPLRE